MSKDLAVLQAVSEAIASQVSLNVARRTACCDECGYVGPLTDEWTVLHVTHGTWTLCPRPHVTRPLSYCTFVDGRLAEVER